LHPTFQATRSFHGSNWRPRLPHFPAPVLRASGRRFHKLHPAPSAQPNAAPCRGGPACPPILIHLRALPCSRKAAAPRGASRQACHAGGHAGRATQSRTLRESQSPSAAKTGGVARRTARSTSTRRRPPWSKPPGLPCRRSRRQSHTIPSCAGVPTPSGPHACALHLNPPRRVGAAHRVRPLFSTSVSSVSSVVCFSPCSPCPPWFVFLRVLRVLCTTSP